MTTPTVNQEHTHARGGEWVVVGSQRVSTHRVVMMLNEPVRVFALSVCVSLRTQRLVMAVREGANVDTSALADPNIVEAFVTAQVRVPLIG